MHLKLLADTEKTAPFYIIYRGNLVAGPPEIQATPPTALSIYTFFRGSAVEMQSDKFAIESCHCLIGRPIFDP